MKILDRAILGHIQLLSRVQDYTAIGHPIPRVLLFVMISQPSQQKLFFRATAVGSEFAVWRICDAPNGSLVKFVLTRQAGKGCAQLGMQKIAKLRNNEPRRGWYYRFPIHGGSPQETRRCPVLMLVYSTEHEALVRLQNHVQPTLFISRFE